MLESRDVLETEETPGGQSSEGPSPGDKPLELPRLGVATDYERPRPPGLEEEKRTNR
jgi:hypothetical protein